LGGGGPPNIAEQKRDRGEFRYLANSPMNFAKGLRTITLDRADAAPQIFSAFQGRFGEKMQRGRYGAARPPRPCGKLILLV